jgi:pseudaminic acid synthase
MSFSIGGLAIGGSHPPLVVAELSGNHNQSLERALALVDAAGEAGVRAIKFQTYTADTLTLNLTGGDFVIRDPNSLWNGRTLYDLYREAHTPWEWHGPLFERARSLGMVPFSTPFDLTAVEFLEQLDVACYKIASFECTHLPLLHAVGATRKPIVLSTGMASLAEIEAAVETLRNAGSSEIVLLKCTSNYPASPENSNLKTIPHLREIFGCEVGLSDHTMGIGAPVAAVALGAVLIEKHFTMRRSDGGVDSAFSLEPEELRQLVIEVERGWQALGRVSVGCSPSEQASRQFRQSIYVAKDIAAGERLTDENIRIVRPGRGLAPRFYSDVVGRVALQAIERGTPLDWSLISGRGVSS